MSRLNFKLRGSHVLIFFLISNKERGHNCKSILCFIKSGLSKILVSASADISLGGHYFKTIIPVSFRLLIQWYFISICLTLDVYFRDCILLWLTSCLRTYNLIAEFCGMSRSSKSLIIYKISCATFAAYMYQSSVEKRIILVSFLVIHWIGILTSRNRFPVYAVACPIGFVERRYYCF